MSDLVEKITQAFELEQKKQRKAVNPDDIPSSYEAITPEWLTHILCEEYPGAKVVSCQLGEADDGNTNRRRIFITYNEAGEEANLPSSVFCKASYHLATRLQNALGGLIEGEDTFYNVYRKKLDIEAPVCLLSTYDPESFNSILMLDDLVRHSTEFCNHDTEITRQRANSQMDLLAKLHGSFYNTPEIVSSTLPKFDKVFRNIDAWWGMEKLCYNGFIAAESVIPPRFFRQHEKIWPATLMSIDLHAKLPCTLTHNDVHLRNWYITADGAMGLCDWQCFGLGHWGRDFAYTITTALNVEDRRKWEKELLKYYLDKLHIAGGSLISFDKAWKYYRQHLFTALAFWTSTLLLENNQPKEASIAFVHRIATAIDDLDALNSFE